MTLIMENDVQYIVEPLFLYLRFIAMTLLCPIATISFYEALNRWFVSLTGYNKVPNAVEKLPKITTA